MSGPEAETRLQRYVEGHVELVELERRREMERHEREIRPLSGREAQERDLDRSLFERLTAQHGDGIVEMLRVQYRMHEKIMDFSARTFYDNRLRAHESVEAHTLRDLGIDDRAVDGDLRRILVPEDPVVSPGVRAAATAVGAPPGSVGTGVSP